MKAGTKRGQLVFTVIAILSAVLFIMPLDLPSAAYAAVSGSSTTLQGDLNGDGRVDCLDLILLKIMLNNATPPGARCSGGDINCDGKITTADRDLLIDIILGRVRPQGGGGGGGGGGSTPTPTPTPTPTTYNLITNTVGSGTATNNTSNPHNSGSVVLLTAAPASCWTFSGWSGSGLSGNSLTTTITIDSDKSVTATFTQITYNLSLNASPLAGGTPTMDSGPTYNCGVNATIHANTNTSGSYTFAGWSPSAGVADRLAETTTVTMSRDRTLNASYNAPDTSTLFTAVVGNGSVTLNHSNPQANGSVVLLTAHPATGWSFSNWSGAITGTTSPATITMDDNKWVTATFTQDEYTLTTSVVGSGTVTPASGTSYLSGTAVDLTATPNSSCWAFANWSGNITGTTSPATITMDSNMSVTATFTQITYNLSLNASPLAGGTPTMDGGPTYNCGVNATIHANVNTSNGYEFAYWYPSAGVADILAEITTVTMSQNRTLIAYYNTPSNYTLTTPAVGNGTVATNTSNPQAWGSDVLLTANPDPGWSFSNWSVDLSGTANPATIKMNRDKSVTATFTQITYNLTTSAVGSGTVTTDSNNPHNSGSTVQVFANPAAGYTFSNWSGAITGTTSPATITMDSNKSVTATFTVIPNSTTVFTSGGTWTVPAGVTSVTVLVVAGGGGGGSGSVAGYCGGGGGAGGVNSQANFTVTPGVNVTVIVGGGGSAAKSGGNSSFGSSASGYVNATGGGGGSSDSGTAGSGGSGGGGAAWTSGISNGASSNASGQGNSGGNGVYNCYNTAGGGGGAGGAGGNGGATGCLDPDIGGTGGIGKNYSGTFGNVGGLGTGWFAGGGGGAGAKTGGSASSGGGAGGTGAGTAGTANTGGGGGGGTNAAGGNGGSGYVIVKYTATYNLTTSVIAGNGNITVNTSNPHNIGSVVLLTANPDPGWNFAGWSGNLSGSANPTSILMNSNKSVNATFTQANFNLTTVVAPAGAITAGCTVTNDSANPHSNGSTVNVTAHTVTGWTFSGWSGGLTGSANPATITMNSDKSVTATFTEITYNLTTAVSPGAAGVAGCTVTNDSANPHSNGSTVNVTAHPVAGWIFSNWSGNLSGTTNPATITMDGDKSVTANFTQVSTYNLTMAVSPGAADVAGCTVTNDSANPHSNGSTVNVTAHPVTGWIFSNWSGNLSGSSNPATVTMDGDKSVTANFTQVFTYNLTTAVYPTDAITAGCTVTNDSANPHSNGSTVNVTAHPVTGWIFSNWSGNLSGSSNPATVTMDGNKSVTANFTQVFTYNLTTTVAPAGAITAGCTVTNDSANPHSNGSTVNVTAHTVTGWTFSGWSGNLSGTTNPATITMDGNKSVTATFTQITYNLSTIVSPAEAIAAGCTVTNDSANPHNSGSTVNITAHPASGWAFYRWTGNLSGSANPATITMDSNKSVNATFIQNSPPTVTSISLNHGATIGGNNVTITGTGFVSGANVTIGGASATDVTWVSSTSLTATAPNGTVGAKDVVVTNPDAQTGTLSSGYTYAVLTAVYQSTYSGQPVSYWKFTWLLQETLPSGSGAGQTLGGPCDKYEIRVYSDAACTTTMTPTRTASSVDITIQSPMNDWRHITDRQLRERYNQAKAFGMTVTNWLYYRLYTPSSFGAPYALGESWTFTEQIDSDQSAGDKTTAGITAAVASATESVTVPAGTFTCYKLTITESGKTIIEYWDAEGRYPYGPVKQVDSVNFANTDTRVLYSSNAYP